MSFFNLPTGDNDDLTDVPGIRVGHAQDVNSGTGVTVILFPERGAISGCRIGGSAPSTRQMDSLDPVHIVDRIHAICLSGGSAFGLDAAGGVLAFLAENGVGFRVGDQIVPIVPSAVIFDLNFKNSGVKPDSVMGRAACLAADLVPMPQGSVGAGTGATVGKLYGMAQAMKGGLGSASVISDRLVVAALVVVNAYGDILDRDGSILAGARTAPDSFEFADSTAMLVTGKARSRSLPVENTTLAIVATNACCDQTMCTRIAGQSTLGLGHVIRPFHSHIDGDLTIVLSLGDVEADPNRVSLMAASVLGRAVRKAIRKADGLETVPAWRDIADPVPFNS